MKSPDDAENQRRLKGLVHLLQLHSQIKMTIYQSPEDLLTILLSAREEEQAIKT